MAVGTPPRLPISEAAVYSVLAAQPKMRMDAPELAALFAPRDDAERQQLTLIISRVAKLGDGVVSLCHPGQPAALSPGADAVRSLLCVQPGGQMEAARLRSRFAPEGEQQRRQLALAISEVCAARTVLRSESRGPT